MTYITVAPITSTLRDAKSQVYLDIEDLMQGPCVINFDQITTLPVEHVEKRMARLSAERMKEVCKALNFALGCDHAL